MVQLVLASASPRRVALLRQIGYQPLVSPSSFQEDAVVAGEDPVAYVKRQALCKARDVTLRYPDAAVLAADTVVVLDHEIIGKPLDVKTAKAVLQRLSGRRHMVYTGVAVVYKDKIYQTCGATAVYMRALSEDRIDWYVGTGEPMDKAGAYGIQGYGALLVEKIEGCYFNVVGLPLIPVADCLEQIGVGQV